MNVQELQALLDDEDSYGIDDTEGITIIETSEDIDRKWVFTTSIVQCDQTKNYFRVVESRSNSGYWGDSEKGDTTVEAVEPITKTVIQTTWKAIK